jgi:hypothetical protein
LDGAAFQLVGPSKLQPYMPMFVVQAGVLQRRGCALYMLAVEYMEDFSGLNKEAHSLLCRHPPPHSILLEASSIASHLRAGGVADCRCPEGGILRSARSRPSSIPCTCPWTSTRCTLGPRAPSSRTKSTRMLVGPELAPGPSTSVSISVSLSSRVAPGVSAASSER